MNLTIRSVDVTYIHQIWSTVKPYIEDALTKGHDFPDWAYCYNIDHVQQYVTSGQWLLLVAIDEENTLFETGCYIDSIW